MDLELRQQRLGQFAQVPLLVLKPQLPQQIDCRVLEEWLDDLLLGLGTVESRGVSASKKARYVSRGKHAVE
jgi:hypothetical protein